MESEREKTSRGTLTNIVGSSPDHIRPTGYVTDPALRAKIVLVAKSGEAIRLFRTDEARERPRFRPALPLTISGLAGRKSGRHKAPFDNDTSLNLTHKGPAT